jgi:adenosylcobinamide-phosphate synthase
MDWLILSAFVLDLLLGDPRPLPHPVVHIGNLINRLELFLVGLIGRRRDTGVLLVFLTLVISGAVAWGLIALGRAFSPAVGFAVGLWLAWTTLALHSLHKESRTVVKLVEQGELEEARSALALIVGRQTSHLDEEGIMRACIETVAENTSDGLVAPLFYLFLGGPILAILYKAVNTLDSMIGYRDDRYRELGWAAARLDDLVNLVPARLTAVLMTLAAFPLGLNGFNALKILRRDARLPDSPNAGFPEAAAAGALGVQLGGPAIYFGEATDKPRLGDSASPVSPRSYRQMVHLMYLTSFLALGLGLLLEWLFKNVV